MATIGQFIRNARTLKGLSLRRLAQGLHVTPAFLSHIELGHSLLPDRLVDPLAKALELEVETLREIAYLERAPESLRQKVAPMARYPRLREAILAHATDAKGLLDVLASTPEHPLETTIIDILQVILDEWIVNWIPECNVIWDKYVKMGLLLPRPDRKDSDIYAFVFQYPAVWEEVILTIPNIDSSNKGIGYADRVQTAARLREYLVGAPLRWEGFEHTVEEALRAKGCSQTLLWELSKANIDWKTVPVLSDHRFQPQIETYWDHRRRYLDQVGLPHPGVALTAIRDLFQDPSFAVEGLFHDHHGTSILIETVTYDPATATLRFSPAWHGVPLPIGFAPRPMFAVGFVEARRRLFCDGLGLSTPNRGARSLRTEPARARLKPSTVDSVDTRRKQRRLGPE